MKVISLVLLEQEEIDKSTFTSNYNSFLDLIQQQASIYRYICLRKFYSYG
jgi:hypothetical protein